MSEQKRKRRVYDQGELARRARRRRAREIRAARTTVRVLCLAVVLGAVWSWRTELPELAYAQGSIEPRGSLRAVEHVDGGAVSEIPVREGEAVGNGTVLVRISGQDLLPETEQLATRRDQLDRTIERTRTVLAAIGTDPHLRPSTLPDGAAPRARSRIEAYETRRRRLVERIGQTVRAVASAEALIGNAADRLAVFDEELERAENLSERGLTTRSDVADLSQRRLALAAERLRAEQGLREAEAERSEAEILLQEFADSFRDTLLEEMDALSEERALVARAIASNAELTDRLVVLSTVEGVVHRLYVTSPGDVIVPGGLVAEVLPTDESLIAEIRLRPQDIGQIGPGDPVELKATAFSPKRYGVLSGRVSRISPTSSTNDDGEAFFEVRVELASQFIGEGQDRTPLRAGLEVQAAVVTGSGTVLDYVLQPVVEPFRMTFGGG